jgi:hypothetical protein
LGSVPPPVLSAHVPAPVSEKDLRASLSGGVSCRNPWALLVSIPIAQDLLEGRGSASSAAFPSTAVRSRSTLE